MPCLTPYRGDTSQMLLFKIASCLEASGGSGGAVTAAQIIAALGCTPACEGDVVNSFNGQVGDVVLTLADVSTVADARYVLKAGDTMTGALVHPDGTAALPSITFTGDVNTGIFHSAADTLDFSTAGTARWQVNPAGDLTGAGNISAGGQISVGSFVVLAVGGRIVWQGLSRILSPSDGVIELTDSSQTTFDRLQLGGTTSAFPSIKRQGAGIDFRVADDSAYALITSGGLTLSTASLLSITSGANQRAGDAVLVGGTVTVANTTVTANTRVYLTRKVAGGTIGFAVTYTLIAAASFTITSDNVLDTSTYSYLLIEVP